MDTTRLVKFNTYDTVGVIVSRINELYDCVLQLVSSNSWERARLVMLEVDWLRERKSQLQWVDGVLA